MKRSKARGAMFMAVSLAVALAAAAAPIFLFWPSRDRIAVDKESWTMPGGGPAHASYLNLAPKGALRERWETRLEGMPAGPLAVAGGFAYAACDNGLLYALDLETGKPLWRYDAGSGISSMPAVFEGGVLVGTVDGRVVGVNPQGEPDWEFEAGGAVSSTPIPAQGRVYFGSDDGYVYCVSARDGSLAWSFDAGSQVKVSPCVFEGLVFAASYEGDLFALEAGSGRLTWTYRSGGLPVACPAADDGRVFLATELSVSCLEAQSGKMLWESAVNTFIISNLVLRGSKMMVVHGGAGGSMEAICLDARTGDSLWTSYCGVSPAWTAAAASNADLYLAGREAVLAVSAESGMPSLEHRLQGVIAGTLTLTERFVLAGTDARKVYCLEE